MKPLSPDPELQARLAALPEGSTPEEYFREVLRWREDSARERPAKEAKAPSNRVGGWH